MEYFKIWIVNLGLSIVTLGIYSAWAKVRTNRYIYGSTLLDGTSFQYTASPVGILRGRLIATAVFSLYMLFSRFFPQYGIFMLAFIMLFVPWMVVKSLRFRSRYSRYRNINLDFTGTVKEAFKYWFLYYFLVIITAGIMYPVTEFKQKEFMVNRNRYGQTPFNFKGLWGEFLVVYILAGLIATGILFAAAIVLGIIIAVIVSLLPQADTATVLEHTFGKEPMSFLILIASIYLAYIPTAFYVIAYKRTRIFNYIFNNTTLGAISFKSTLKISRIFWIYFSNFFAIVLTLGLMYPWAAVRLIRYRLENISLESDESLDVFLASETQNISAMGEEIGEAFDFDISI